MQPDIIFAILILIVSVILHEVAHGYMANYLGDPTARLAGRLTLNPISHIDPVGSILLPVLLIVTNSPFLIGWAKPVPYNPYNLRGYWGEALVAGAGPAVNIALALFFALIIRFFAADMSEAFLSALATIVLINMLLALFNLLPIPPLDGSKVLSAILPGPLGRGYEALRAQFEQAGMFVGLILILILFYFFGPLFFSALRALFYLLTGIAF